MGGFQPICLPIDTIQLTSDKSAKGALISIDLEKAYDLVDRKLLWWIMEGMGYPHDFISMLESVYSHTEMSFLNEDVCK